MRNLIFKLDNNLSTYTYVQIGKVLIAISVIIFSLFFTKENRFNFYIPALASTLFISSLISLVAFYLIKENLKKLIPYFSSVTELIILCSFINISGLEFNTLIFWGYAVICSNYFFTDIKFTSISSFSFLIFSLLHSLNYLGEINSFIDDSYHKTFLLSQIAFGVFNFFTFYLIESKTKDFNKELEEINKYNKLLIDALPGFVSWVDFNLTYKGVNKNMCQFFCLDESNFIGTKIGELTGHERDRLSNIVSDFIKSNQLEYQNKFNYIYEGKTYHNIISLVRYGEGVIIVTYDITKMVEAEDIISTERQRAQTSARLASFGEISAGIAHEINNPLAVISALNFKLNMKIKKNEEINDFLHEFNEKVDSQIMRISKIVKSIKTLSRDGDNDPFELHSLAKVFDDVRILVEPKCEGKDIILSFPQKLDQVNLLCQSVQLGQVFIILINNAIDAIIDLDERWIKIHVNNYKEGIELEFIDSGPGIPKDVVKDIFMPFFTTKGVGKGTGLGLSLAVKIIKLHKGEIRVDHSSKNTKFTIYLPKLQNKLAK
jgi:signal transduction histidine kinase/uncharacterized membrane protein YwaF